MYLGGGESGTLEVTFPFLCLHSLLVARCATLYFPEFLTFSPTSHPLPWLGYGAGPGLTSQTWAVLVTGALPRSPQGPPWLHLGPRQGPAPPPLLPSPRISALPPLLASPILATPVLRPPPSASGLISVSFALYCSLTGIIKIRINREVSITLPISSSSCLSDWLCLRLSHSLWLSLSLSLSSFPSTCAPNTNRPLQGLPRAEDSTRSLFKPFPSSPLP